MTLKQIVKDLNRSLGHKFRDKRLLEMALTHPSRAHEREDTEEDNQRLEFLGDAILAALSAAYLYETYPSWPEGELTKLRSALTNRDTISRLARQINLGDYLLMGRGEEQSGGASKSKNLCDAMEALIGAAYLDGGFKGASRIFQKLFQPEVASLAIGLRVDNPKGRFQEMAQGSGFMNPTYSIVDSRGPAHDPEFIAVVKISEIVMGKGIGSNKKIAHANAAQAALDMVGDRQIEEVLRQMQQDPTVVDHLLAGGSSNLEAIHQEDEDKGAQGTQWDDDSKDKKFWE